MGYENAINEAS